jgi:tetratricopeptide (TPR) repeat protein
MQPWRMKTTVKNLDRWIGAVLLLLTLAVYWPVTRHAFINFDDPLYVTDNPVVQNGLSAEGVRWAFETRHASNWHPLTWISHMLDCSVFQLDPAGHHLMNLVFHLLNVVLLYAVLRRMAGSHWRCALVAALFAWHPLHVESVAWIAERKDVLSTCFFLLSLSAYVRYAQAPAASSYVLTLALFACSLMSKPMLVTGPFLLLLLDYWPLQRWQPPLADTEGQAPTFGALARSLAPLVKEKLPFLFLSVSSCVLTVWAQYTGGALRSFQAVPLLNRALNATISYGRYISKALWPVDLSVFYPLYANKDYVPAIICALVLVAMSLLVWRGRRTRPYLAVGWLWYLGSLTPVIGLVQVGGQSMADRYTYVPFIGLFIMAAWSVADWVMGLKEARYRGALIFLVVIVLLGCLQATGSYLQDWQTSRTLFEHALKVSPDNALANNCLGVALQEEGRVPEAMRHYSEAVRLNPADPKARWNLAINLAEQGQIPEALFHFSDLERAGQDTAEKHNLFGIALAKQKHFSQAIQHLSTAVRLNPADAKMRYNLAFASEQEGEIAQAVGFYRQALALRPEWPQALQSLAWLLATDDSSLLRNGPEAIRAAGKASLLVGGEDAGYLDTLAAAYAETSRFPEATLTAERALTIALTTKQTILAAQIESRLSLYQKKQPYRQARGKVEADVKEGLLDASERNERSILQN